MRSKLKARIIGTMLGLAIAAAPAAAQLTGVVTDTNGLPLQGVSVEAWNDGGKIAVRLTDDDGHFMFPDTVAFETTVLWAARLGFRPLRVLVEGGIDHYELTLEQEAVSVQGLVVEAPREVCTGGEDSEARLVWERMRSRYHPALDTLGVATYMVWADAFVDLNDIGPLDLPGLAIEQRGSAPQLRFSWDRRVEKQGYAFRTRRVEEDRAFDSWVYAPLHADFSPHFVSNTFGKLHEFQLVEEDDEGWLVAFCPREDKRPRVQGTLTIATDTTLVRADWSFITPEPEENAGGEAVFFEVDSDREHTYLLPAESVFWRQVTLDRYYQRYQRYEGWRVAQGDSVPTLPTRRPEDFQHPDDGGPEPRSR